MQAGVDYPAVALAAYHGFFRAHQGDDIRFAYRTAIYAAFVFAGDVFAYAARGLVNDDSPLFDIGKDMPHRERHGIFFGQYAARGGNEHEPVAVGVQGKADSNFLFFRE